MDSADEKRAVSATTALMSAWRVTTHDPSAGLKNTGSSRRARARNG